MWLRKVAMTTITPECPGIAWTKAATTLRSCGITDTEFVDGNPQNAIRISLASEAKT